MAFTWLNINKSAIRSLIRAGVVFATAFGLQLEPAQIGAIQLLTEAILAVLVFSENRPPVSGVVDDE